ncbi:MAG: MFS transporter [Pseudomonadota bacterium]
MKRARTPTPTSWYLRPVFGWPVLFAAFAGMFGNVGPLIYASFAFIVQELEAEFGWARSDITLAISLLTFSSAVAHPLFGGIVDRFGVRMPSVWSFLLMSAALLSVPLFLSEIWHLWVSFAAIAILGVANNTLPFIKLAATWYDKRRGLMIGIVASATGLGLAILPALTGRIVDTYGWEGGFVWYGLYIALFTTPILFFFAQDHPNDIGYMADGAPLERGDVDAAADHTGLTLGEAMRTQAFWVLAVGILVASLALWGITNQLALLLGDRGMSRADAGSVATVLGLSMASSRLVIGWLLDRLFAPLVACAIFLGAGVGFWLLATGGVSAVVYVSAALLGLGLGAEIELIGFMVSRYFGLRAFGTIYGSIFVGFLLGTSWGPFIYARAQETFGVYDPRLVCDDRSYDRSRLRFSVDGPL